MKNWYVNHDYLPDVKKDFSNFEKVLTLKSGEIISQSSIGYVIKYITQDHTFYIKVFLSRGKKWRKIFGRSRYHAEKDNLIFCKNLGINTPDIVAFGHQTKWWGLRFKMGILVTAEVKKAVNFKEIALHHPDFFRQSQWRLATLKQIATYVALLHQRNFLHYDLQWRNILVTLQPTPQVYFFDMPSGRLYNFFLKYHLKRDFFNLYKSAILFLSKTDQLRFYLYYKNQKSLSQEDKHLIKKWVSYYLHKEPPITC